MLGQAELDLHMRDVEILLRAVAVAKDSESYRPSMVQFLNRFSQSAQSFDSPTVLEISETVSWFFDACSDLGSQAFLSRQGRFTVPLFEATFASACQGRPTLGSDWRLTDNIVTAIRNDEDFQSHSQEQTTNATHVLGRLSAARKYLTADR